MALAHARDGTEIFYCAAGTGLPLLLSTAEEIAFQVGALFYYWEKGINPFQGPGTGFSAPARRHDEVFLHAQRWKNASPLRYKRQSHSRDFMGLETGYVLFLEYDPPLTSGCKTDNRMQGGGFPHSIPSKKACYRACVGFQRNTLKHMAFSIKGVYIR